VKPIEPIAKPKKMPPASLAFNMEAFYNDYLCFVNRGVQFSADEIPEYGI
jgi:hypothetical protein|tara:strand:+ start:23660 stop:23809 length:150 start_codon:yes stop_codon:yes gene_type:complete